jgi:hypothetical protein
MFEKERAVSFYRDGLLNPSDIGFGKNLVSELAHMSFTLVVDNLDIEK